MNAIEIRILAGLVGPCPACGSGTLEPVFDGEHFNFRCPARGLGRHRAGDGRRRRATHRLRAGDKRVAVVVMRLDRLGSASR